MDDWDKHVDLNDTQSEIFSVVSAQLYFFAFYLTYQLSFYPTEEMHAHLLALTASVRQFKLFLWIWLPYENVHYADQLHTVVYIFCLYISLKTANDREHEKLKCPWNASLPI